MGSVQLESFEEKGYMPLIDALGQDLWEFLEHIDALHQNLGAACISGSNTKRNASQHRRHTATRVTTAPPL